jgi:hypothetical protein
MTEDEWQDLIAPTVAECQMEILADVRQGRVPADVPDFATLHDYVNANEYGRTCDADEDGLGGWDFAGEGGGMTFWGRVHAAVDRWIKDGGIKEALS